MPITKPRRDPRLMVIAERIARDLFTNGIGERADRLVITQDGPRDEDLKRDLGGWCERAVVDRVYKILESEHC